MPAVELEMTTAVVVARRSSRSKTFGVVVELVAEAVEEVVVAAAEAVRLS